MFFKKHFLKSFKFESIAQEKGLKAFICWLRKNKLNDKDIRPSDLFFIQKDHDSNEYWRELVASQVSTLQNDIKMLSDKLEAAHKKIEELCIIRVIENAKVKRKRG